MNNQKVTFFRSIHFKLVIIYVLLIILGMQIIGVYFGRALETRLIENFTSSLSQRIDLMAYNIEQAIVKAEEDASIKVSDEISSVLKDYKGDEIREILVVDKEARIIGTSDFNEDIIGKRTTENMITRALVVGSTNENIKIDRETNHRMYVISTPIVTDFKGETIGAIYVIASMEEVFSLVRTINTILATGTGISLLITVILGIFLARTITRPLSDMRKQAAELAKGNFSRTVKIYGEDEIGQLATAFNHLTKEIEEAQETTEGERRKLASVIAHMTEGVIATDAKGQVILVNTPATKMFNVSRETALKTNLVQLLQIEEEFTFEELLDQQEPLILEVRTKERPYILRVNFSPIQKEEGVTNGLIAVVYDITEQERIEQERREFVANVSHELRTPLTTMRSYLEALADGAWKDEEIAPKFLQVTQNETERMIRLVNDLLKLSKLDAKDYQLNKEWVHFIDFFENIIDRFEMSKEQHVTFVRNLPKKDLYVDIDSDKITQVLDNIISNALKYSPEGGRVTFTVKEQEGYLQISVKDEGMGVPEKSVSKIFERFYRVDKARSRQMGGTGLGLAIAKEVVEAHQGKIWAESKEGKGTTIYFTLPYDPNQEDEWE
ncbi:cell wall metabolism sensor histidine kinase WalK [Bacillus sp. FJAT-47783]|uniref:cell wall metabolism sensor histidine kinase WalK n=1 Tax=Bacillus sp. FJAT-47783 TaxID=2922712 RepID=UPI001FAE207E|nr:cell wall metabolism sensor histidine kinase WalK [Bacillus sp. FJAT-47783]